MVRKEVLRKSILIIQVIALFLLVCLIIGLMFSGQSEDAQAATTTATYILDEPYYSGATYHFDSTLSITLTSSNTIHMDSTTSKTTIYTNANSLTLNWKEDGSNNFSGTHNMGIESKSFIKLKDISNVSDVSDETINSLPDKLGLTLPTSATNFTTVTKSVNLNEGLYFLNWEIYFESWGTKINFTGAYLICVDRTQPSGKLNNVDNGDYTNKDVSFSWNPDDDLSSPTATLDGKRYTSGTPITAEGSHTILLTDLAGNSTTYTFTIDKTKPSINASVSNGGYTNSLVTVSASDNNFQTLYYKAPGTSIFQTTSSSSYKISATNGEWQFYALDKAGNRSDTFAFMFDNVSPEVGLRKTDGQAFADGAWVNQGVYFDVSDTNLASTKLYEQMSNNWVEINSDYLVGTIYYDKRLPDVLYGSSEVALAAIIEKENSRLTSKSNWETIPNDTRIIAPNQVDYAFTGATYWEYTLVSGEVYVFFVQSDIDKFVRNQAQSYLSSLSKNTFMQEGCFKVVAEDLAGNRTEKTFNIKLSGPVLEIEPSGYTNEIRYKAIDDLGGLTTYVKIDNGEWVKQDGNDLVFSYGDQDGTYYFRTVDKAGNVVTASAVLFTQKIYDFGNLTDAYNGYKLNAWYEVTLPQYIFGTNTDLVDISGKYSFERYEDAYAWCWIMEEEYRVQTRTNGWIYVSATNESISQVYTSREDLDKVLQKYVARYISERKIISTSGSDNYYVIKDSSGRNDEYAFIRQDIRLPNFLSSYTNYEVLQMSSSFAFKRCAAAVAPTTVYLTYLADDYSIQTQKSVIVPYGKSIKSVLEASDMYRQGYYLVTESDQCGNSQSYVVYIDLEAPKIRASVELGDGTKKELVFDSDFAEDNAWTFYYISFEVESIIDNVDSYTAIKLEGRGLTTTVFVPGDELPVLDAALGGGQYVITVYDRSSNVFQFKVNIANKLPTMEYNSLRATNRQLTLYFATNDTLNQIVKLEIYKINGSGESVKIEVDDLGKQIDFTTLEYNFTVGGKYYAIITDRYGRVIETEPIFYERGLPSGELSTTINSYTNKDVYFTYDVGNGVVVYVYDEDYNLVIYTDYLLEYDNLNKVYSLGFLASDGLEREYLIHLYNEADDNLYMEYKFGIDTVIATVNVQDLNGNTIDKGGYTNQAFTLNWTESNVRVKYTIGSSVFSTLYTRGDLLNGNGLYTFNVTDAVGNTETFTVYLDNIVDYVLEGGKIVNVGGKYLTNSPVALTVNEMVAEWIVADGKEVYNGIAITQEGIYTITVSDRYGNTVVIVIELDLTPPEITLQGVENGGSTKSNVVVTFEEDAKCYVMRGSIVVREIRSGEVFDAHGSYTLRTEDLAGNITDIAFDIDIQVDFQSNVINRQITTEVVSFVLSEDGEVEVIRDGQAIDVSKTYSESGKYVITVVDNVGNSLVFTFTILPKYAQELIIELDSQQALALATFNGEAIKLEFGDDTKKRIELTQTGKWVLTFSDLEKNQNYTVYLNIDNVAPSVDLIWSGNTVSFSRLNKDGVTAVMYKDGEEVKWTQSLVVKDPGHYVLVLEDEFGNINEIEWDLKYRLNGLSITLIVLACLATVGVIVLILVKRLKVKVS